MTRIPPNKGQRTIKFPAVQELYWKQGLTLKDITRQLGCSQTTVWRVMAESGIPRRTSEQSLKITGRENTGRFRKGMAPWNKGKPCPDEIKKKVAAKKRGVPTWNKGIPMNEWMPQESNEVRKAKIKKNNPRYWLGKKRPDLANKLRDPQIAQKMHRARFKHPTKPEQRLIEVISKDRLPYLFCGDGSVYLFGLYPDYINTNGAKKVIEVFGTPFHNPEATFLPEIPLSRQEKYRKALYASLGFDCLILWDNELNKLTDKEIADRIRKFTRAKNKPTAQLQLWREL